MIPSVPFLINGTVGVDFSYVNYESYAATSAITVISSCILDGKNFWKCVSLSREKKRKSRHRELIIFKYSTRIRDRKVARDQQNRTYTPGTLYSPAHRNRKHEQTTVKFVLSKITRIGSFRNDFTYPSSNKTSVFFFKFSKCIASKIFTLSYIIYAGRCAGVPVLALAISQT